MTRKGFPEGYIGHHTLFEEKTMSAQKHSKKWRVHPGMRVILPEADEQALHRELPGLPRPSKPLAQRALDHLAVLPKDMGRLETFSRMTYFIHDIADRWSGTPIGTEAKIFSEHFQNQKTFFQRALTKQEEEEILLLQRLAVELADTPELPNAEALGDRKDNNSGTNEY